MLSSAALALLATWPLHFAAAEPADDALEATVPDAFASAATWYTAEATATDDTAHLRPGSKAEHVIDFHVDVDHSTGEPNYPIGWPRVGIAPQPHWDWSGYDYLEFWVLAETSRDKLPATALGIVISMPDRNTQVSENVPAVKGEWVRYRVNLEDLPNPKDVARLQWFISESNYSDKDSVDFYVADLALYRYTKPALLAFQPLESLVSTTATYLPVDLQLVGVAEGEAVQGEVVVRRHGTELAKRSVELTRGKRRVILPLPADLTPGEAELAVRFDGRDAATAKIRVVAGPFGER